MAGLMDGDVHVGDDFLDMIAKTNCKIVPSNCLHSTAQYVSYSYYDPANPFPNEIWINEKKVKTNDILELVTPLNHETFHAAQKNAAPALHHSPFNRNTRTIVHPLEWIRLETLCESDAPAKEAWTNSLLSKRYPALIEKSAHDLIPVIEFDALRAHYDGSLQETMTHCAKAALQKLKWRASPDYTLAHHYAKKALDNFERGMALRIRNGEKDFTFLRLDDADLHAVGAYDFGPNSFGEDELDPYFKRHPNLLPRMEQKLAALCRQYDIPPLESCPSLQGHAHKPKAELSFNNSASSMQSLELS